MLATTLDTSSILRGGRYLLLGMLACTQSVAADFELPNSLKPLPESQWNRDMAAHLLERTGFGPSSEEIATAMQAGRAESIRRAVYFTDTTHATSAPENTAVDFEPSGIFKPALDPFPPSRPATTRMAQRDGEALGIAVKPAGNRPIQPIVNEFFYWLRASRLETDRLSYWWAERMLTTNRPLVERMALFWHGHFATNEDKVRDYRKMQKQLALFHQHGLGNFRDLLIGIAQHPAMLAFLDAGVNVKGSPNENFAREIMELFTMGVGQYSESDVREAARAFTGWNFEGLTFHIDTQRHDAGIKTVLGHTGNFDGIAVIDHILAEPATARFIATKLYRHFVSANPSPQLQESLGALLRHHNYELRPFLSTLFASRDFYAHRGSRIKPPVEFIISTYRKLGQSRIPGNPDFNHISDQLGQRLFHPPTVAGWPKGRSWITPGLLFERGNFVLDALFPDIAFIPPDRYPSRTPHILPVHERLRAGMDISRATRPTDSPEDDAMMAASNLLADRDEAFNTRYGSYRGWQMAIEQVRPIPRFTARIALSDTLLKANIRTSDEAVRYLVAHFFTVPPEPSTQRALSEFLTEQLGTNDIQAAASYLEEPLRQLLHLLLTQPEYQLG